MSQERIRACIEAYVAAWNERDPAQRRRLVEQACAEDLHMRTPGRLLEGRAQLEALLWTSMALENAARASGYRRWKSTMREALYGVANVPLRGHPHDRDRRARLRRADARRELERANRVLRRRRSGSDSHPRVSIAGGVPWRAAERCRKGPPLPSLVLGGAADARGLAALPPSVPELTVKGHQGRRRHAASSISSGSTATRVPTLRRFGGMGER